MSTSAHLEEERKKVPKVGKESVSRLVKPDTNYNDYMTGIQKQSSVTSLKNREGRPKTN